VPHISLVLREMWDTTNAYVPILEGRTAIHRGTKVQAKAKR
jgi:hypothetical protein